MNAEIPKTEELEEKVFSVHNEESFASIALQVYHFQYHNNKIYREYCHLLKRSPDAVKELTDIPFLPISFFKSHKVTSGIFEPQLVFESSGTTGLAASKHYIKNSGLYQKSFLSGFQQAYGRVEDYCILGLLPSYLQRGNSSLVYMVDRLIKKTGNPLSGFYLNDYEKLSHVLTRLEEEGQKTILIGVTYALLDFSSQYPLRLKNTIIMETGGMKGRGKELTRTELYENLKAAFSVKTIHSEYGMTELLSQAYSVNGLFRTPPWMRVLSRDETDPLTMQPLHQHTSGAINVIDFANLYSCSFLATEDAGKIYPDGSFEVLGRLDNSDIRGCSLMVL